MASYVFGRGEGFGYFTCNEASQGVLPGSYVVNVAPYKHGVSYRNGWVHIDGWSEAVLDYIREHEAFEQEAQAS